MSSVLTKDVERLQRDVAKLEEELQQANATLKANEEQIETSTTAKERESSELRQGQDRSNLELQQAKATLQAKEQEINQLRQEKDQLNLELQQAKATLQANEEQIQALRATKEREINELRQEQDRLGLVLQEAEVTLQVKEEQIEAKEEIVLELRSRFEKATRDVDKRITFGLMALEQGWYSQAREHFGQALEAVRNSAAAAVAPIQEEPVEALHKAERKRNIPQERVKGRGRSPMQWFKRQSRLGKMAILACVPLLLLGFCVGLVSMVSPTPEAAPIPVEATQTPTPVGTTPTPVPPIATPMPPTATPIPLTPTPVPPTATPMPPTPTPMPPTPTPVPPTPTPVPPTPTPVVYVVKAGDTLGAIAKAFGVTVEALQEANGISDPRRLQIGQELIIPTAVSPSP